MRLHAAVIATLVGGALALAGCDDSPAVFIALQSDFAEFESWQSYPLSQAPLSGHPDGPRVGFLNKIPPHGSTTYPVGSIIVKEVQSTAAAGDFTQWALFAMVKRGGGYNSDGARDWEFFLLQFNKNRVPVIVSRGLAPSSADGGDIYQNATGAGLRCNYCHAALDTEKTDHILSPLLVPASF